MKLRDSERFQLGKKSKTEEKSSPKSTSVPEKFPRSKRRSPKPRGGQKAGGY
jgi:hypothetical protein